jgi:hypothetical protein
VPEDLEATTVVRSIRFPADVNKWLRREAYEQDTYINGLVVAAVREAMAAKEAAR